MKEFDLSKNYDRIVTMHSNLHVSKLSVDPLKETIKSIYGLMANDSVKKLIYSGAEIKYIPLDEASGDEILFEPELSGETIAFYNPKFWEIEDNKLIRKAL